MQSRVMTRMFGGEWFFYINAHDNSVDDLSYNEEGVSIVYLG